MAARGYVLRSPWVCFSRLAVTCFLNKNDVLLRKALLGPYLHLAPHQIIISAPFVVLLKGVFEYSHIYVTATSGY